MRDFNEILKRAKYSKCSIADWLNTEFFDLKTDIILNYFYLQSKIEPNVDYFKVLSE